LLPLISHSLRSVVPLGCFLVAVLHRRLRPRQRGSTFVERHGSPSAGPSQRVLPVFIRALRKTFRLSLASLSASATGVITTANRSAVVLSQSLTTPFADPFAGLEGRNPRDGESYTEKIFSGQFSMCFIFRKMIYSIFDERNCMSRNFRLPVARHLRCVTIAILKRSSSKPALVQLPLPFSTEGV
jgi:hypothetical protein